MTDFWYRGSYRGSASFFQRVLFQAAPALDIRGDTHIAGYGSDDDWSTIERHSTDFARELQSYADSLQPTPKG
jgi:hypothetical protein